MPLLSNTQSLNSQVLTILIFLGGYLYGVFLGGYFVESIVSRMWEMLKKEVAPKLKGNKNSEELRRYPWQTHVVGWVERVIYVTAIIIGPQGYIGIGVWLTLKTVAVPKRWTEGKIIPGRAIYSNFIAGNGLSILFSAAAAEAIQFALGINEHDMDGVIATAILISVLIFSFIVINYLNRQSKTSSKT